jgi:hypothetical protein
MNNPHEVGTEEWARQEQKPYVSRFFKESHNPKYCCASVHDGDRSVGFHQCSRKPKVHYGALGYCRQHDPVAVQAKRDESARKWRAEWDAKKASYARAEAEKRLREDALSAIRQIAAGHNDPRGLASEILARHEAGLFEEGR